MQTTTAAVSTCPGCGSRITDHRCENPFCWGPCLGVLDLVDPNVVRGQD